MKKISKKLPPFMVSDCKEIVSNHPSIHSLRSLLRTSDTRIFYLLLFTLTIIYTQSTIADFSFKKIYRALIPHKMEQEIVYEELNPQKATIVMVKNKQGNISIKTDPQQKNIFVKATKKAADVESLPKIVFNNEIKNQDIIIASAFNPDEIDGSLDLDIIVPQKMAFNINADNGDVFIKDAQSPLRVNTQKGSISLINPGNSVDAQTHKKGNIALHNPHGRVKAETNSGTISIANAQSSVIANTHNGDIHMFAKEIPSTCMIKLATVTGNISLHLPPDVNADLQASTQYGTVTSDHFITLKPHTTQLNKNSWNYLQKNIQATLGSGEAHIKLSSVKSNIKLLETKIS